ncbi:MAG: K(+)-transporting ATPase subunit C [Prevotella sp.]|jgi:K+-transporting ATPase ATPase C chain
MKRLLKAIRLTVVFCIFLSVFYVLVLWLFAKVAGPNKGNAEVVTLNGRVVGAANVGQKFTDDRYFWGRPSCAGEGYDGMRSGGSNKAVSNPEYLHEVKERINVFLQHHPYLKAEDIPAEMVTASGSGLDPDITPKSADIQVRRVAKARAMSEATVRNIVAQCTEKPLFGFMGTGKVNVLKLNVLLDSLRSY